MPCEFSFNFPGDDRQSAARQSATPLGLQPDLSVEPMKPGEWTSFLVTGFGTTAQDYDFRVTDTRTGAGGVHVVGDQPITRLEDSSPSTRCNRSSPLSPSTWNRARKTLELSLQLHGSKTANPAAASRGPPGHLSARIPSGSTAGRRPSPQNELVFLPKIFLQDNDFIYATARPHPELSVMTKCVPGVFGQEFH